MESYVSIETVQRMNDDIALINCVVLCRDSEASIMPSFDVNYEVIMAIESSFEVIHTSADDAVI